MLCMLRKTPEQQRQLGEQLYQRLQQQFSFPPFRERLLAAVARVVAQR